jgi:hypothetical protein
VSVFAIILLFAAVIVVIAGFALRSGWTIGIGVVVAIVGVVIMIFSASYGVGPGEAKVLKSWTGEVNPNEVSSPGFYWKSPFEDAIDFDTRNQLAVFLGKGTETYNGSPTNGPQISFDDADGVIAEVIGHAGVIPFIRIGETIKIKVIKV